MKKYEKINYKMSSIHTKYFKPEIQLETLKKLGLPRDSFNKKVIVITNETTTDSGKRLLSLHYNQVQIKTILSGNTQYTQKEVEAIKRCRGIIVDADSGEEILVSYPFTNVIVTNSVPSDKLLPITTSNDTLIPIEGEYTRCYGGTLARIFYYDGKVRLSTHKTIDAVNSHFAGSDEFVNIFLKHQNIFPTLDSLYKIGNHDAIHLFILNDRDLIVDSREMQNVDRIVYLKSYSIKDKSKNCDLTSYIEKRNKVCDKPIEICKKLSPSEVNQILSGKIPINMDNIEVTSVEAHELLQKRSLLKSFTGGDRVIYNTNVGVFTLMPTSCFFRSRILDGKVNIKNLFIKSIGDIQRTELVNVAFCLTDLYEIASKIKNNEIVDLTKYTVIESEPILTVLTNLIFIVPEHRIDECFEIYSNYGNLMLETVQFISSIRVPLFEAILENRLDTYDGMQSTGVKFKSYVLSNIPHCMNHDVELNKFIGPDRSWPSEVHDYYGENYKIYNEAYSQNEKDSALEIMKIISFVMSSLGENLYSFSTYKTKVDKERIAIEKRLLKNTLAEV